MRSLTVSISQVAASATLCAAVIPTALAHGGEEGDGMGHGMDMDMSQGIALTANETLSDSVEYAPSYFFHPEHRGLLFAHIGLMVLAWVFILPLATMFSLARSRYTLLAQLVFIAVNALAVLLSTIYNSSTPDLYPNNAHHKLGWLVTWTLSAHVAVSLLGRVVGAFSDSGTKSGSDAAERRSFIPVSHAAMEEHHDRINSARYGPVYRHSDDSGQDTEPNSASVRSASFSSIPDTLASPTAYEAAHKEFADDEHDLEAELPGIPTRVSVMRNLVPKAAANISSRPWKALILAYNVVDRISMILGFVAIATGIITQGRFFEGRAVFTGLAHWIKGGIFFWYGILTLGRWAGCFGDLGWAWNIRPRTASKRWVPSAEFVESALIFTYGSTNIFLEHLSNWGGEWSAVDLEHLSITVLFIGGGLCGMLIESTHVRDLLNSTVTTTIDRNYDDHHERALALAEPQTYSFSVNPIPALVILLLGVMMSSHTQDTMVSSMVHAQWGAMLTGASLARGLSYVLTYIRPPASVLPGRPPTELLAAFGLMTGGLIFMASSGDTVDAIIRQDLDAMFIFTVIMGLVGLLIAWTIICIAIKGWAVRKELDRPADRHHYPV